MTLNRVAMLTLIVAVVLTVSATAGFSAATAERGVSIDVVEDENAFLGLDWHSLERCGNQPLVEVKNQFETKLTDIDIQVVETDRLETELRNVPEQLGPGESATVQIRLDPRQANQTDDRWIRIGIDAEGQGVEVRDLQREVTVTNCPTRGNTAE